MIFFFFFFSFSKNIKRYLISENKQSIPINNDGTISIREFLSLEDAPKFQELPTDDDDFDLEGKVDVDTTLEGSHSSKKRDNQYYFSSVNLKANIVFTSCYSFGAGPSIGSGGAIFVS